MAMAMTGGRRDQAASEMMRVALRRGSGRSFGTATLPNTAAALGPFDPTLGGSGPAERVDAMLGIPHEREGQERDSRKFGICRDPGKALADAREIRGAAAPRPKSDGADAAGETTLSVNRRPGRDSDAVARSAAPRRLTTDLEDATVKRSSTFELLDVDERVQRGYVRAGRLIGDAVGTPPSSRGRRDSDIAWGLVEAYLCADVCPDFAHRGQQIPRMTLPEDEVARLVKRALGEQSRGTEEQRERVRDALWRIAMAGIECHDTFAVLAWVMRTSASRDTLGVCGWLDATFVAIGEILAAGEEQEQWASSSGGGAPPEANKIENLEKATKEVNKAADAEAAGEPADVAGDRAPIEFPLVKDDNMPPEEWIAALGALSDRAVASGDQDDWVTLRDVRNTVAGKARKLARDAFCSARDKFEAERARRKAARANAAATKAKVAAEKKTEAANEAQEGQKAKAEPEAMAAEAKAAEAEATAATETKASAAGKELAAEAEESSALVVANDGGERAEAAPPEATVAETAAAVDGAGKKETQT